MSVRSCTPFTSTVCGWATPPLQLTALCVSRASGSRSKLAGLHGTSEAANLAAGAWRALRPRSLWVPCLLCLIHTSSFELLLLLDARSRRRLHAARARTRSGGGLSGLGGAAAVARNSAPVSGSVLDRMDIQRGLTPRLLRRGKGRASRRVHLSRAAPHRDPHQGAPSPRSHDLLLFLWPSWNRALSHSAVCGAFSESRVVSSCARHSSARAKKSDGRVDARERDA